MKLLAKVVKASRDVFRRVEPLLKELFMKIINGSKPLTFSAKSSVLDILLGPENTSGFSLRLFPPKTASKIFKRVNMPLLHIVSLAILEMNK